MLYCWIGRGLGQLMLTRFQGGNAIVHASPVAEAHDTGCIFQCAVAITTYQCGLVGIIFLCLVNDKGKLVFVVFAAYDFVSSVLGNVDDQSLRHRHWLGLYDFG